jgi:hypothetical protein
VVTRVTRNVVSEHFELAAGDIAVDRLVVVGAEYIWKLLGKQTSENDIGATWLLGKRGGLTVVKVEICVLGDSQRATPTVTCWAGVSASRLGADRKKALTPCQDRTTTRGNGGNVELRALDGHASCCRFKHMFELTPVARNVCARPPLF